MSRPAAPRESTHAALELGLATRAILHRRPSEDGRDDGRRRLASRERPANRTGGGLERACSDSGATRAFPMLRGRSGSVVELRRTVAGLRLGHARERDAAYAPPVAAPGAHECGQPPSPPKGLRQRPPAHPDGPRQVSDNSFRRAHAPASARGGSGSGNGNRASKAPCAPDVSNLLLRAHAPSSARSGSGGAAPEGCSAVLGPDACHGAAAAGSPFASAASSVGIGRARSAGSAGPVEAFPVVKSALPSPVSPCRDSLHEHRAATDKAHSRLAGRPTGPACPAGRGTASAMTDAWGRGSPCRGSPEVGTADAGGGMEEQDPVLHKHAPLQSVGSTAAAAAPNTHCSVTCVEAGEVWQSPRTCGRGLGQDALARVGGRETASTGDELVSSRAPCHAQSHSHDLDSGGAVQMLAASRGGPGDGHAKEQDEEEEDLMRRPQACSDGDAGQLQETLAAGDGGDACSGSSGRAVAACAALSGATAASAAAATPSSPHSSPPSAGVLSRVRTGLLAQKGNAPATREAPKSGRQSTGGVLSVGKAVNAVAVARALKQGLGSAGANVGGKLLGAGRQQAHHGWARTQSGARGGRGGRDGGAAGTRADGDKDGEGEEEKIKEIRYPAYDMHGHKFCGDELRNRRNAAVMQVLARVLS